MYTRDQLKQALIALNPVNIKLIAEDRISLPQLCSITASDCFVEQTPESEHTRILRMAIKDLNTLGYFNYSGVV